MAVNTIDRRTPEEIAAGRGESDLQDSFLDRFDSPGIEGEERAEADARSGVEEVDILMGLRELQVGDPIKWQISRVGEMDQSKNGFLATWSTAQLTQEAIKDAFGGGTYRVRGTFSNGRYAAQRTITVARDAPRTPDGGHVVTPATAPAGGAFNLAEFMAMQAARDEARQRQDDQRRREDQERRDRADEKRQNLILGLAPSVATVLAGLFGNKGPDLAGLVVALKGPTMPEMMQGLASLKALAPEQTTDPLEKAMKIVELLQDRAGGGGETNWTDVLKELAKSGGPMLGALAQRAMEAAPTPRPALGAPTGFHPPALAGPRAPPQPLSAIPGGLANGNGSAGSPAAQTGIATTAGGGVATESPDMNVMQALRLQSWFREQLKTLVQRATRGSSPALYAEVFVDDIPEGLDPGVLVEALQRPDWFQLLTQFDGHVAPHEAWFTELRAAVLAMFDEMRVDPDDQEEAQTLPGGATTGRRQRVPTEAGAMEQVVVKASDEIDRPPAAPPSLTGE